MGLSTGIEVNLDYAGAANDTARMQLLLDALPDPEVEGDSQGMGATSYFDQIQPMALIELRAHIEVIKAIVT